MKKYILFLLAVLTFLCSGCSNKNYVGSNWDALEKRTSQDGLSLPSDTPEQISRNIEYAIQMTKYLVFVPNYFDALYGIGSAYNTAIDNWVELNYSQAAAELMEIEQYLVQRNDLYYPDDLAIVQNSLACINMELADYRIAYDHLIDAYVTMYKLYGDVQDTPEELRFYYRAPALTLCRYYYIIGDYESCLSEIDRLREDIGSHNDENEAIEYLRLFILCTLNNIEGDVCDDRGRVGDAISLYMDSVRLCNNYRETHEDDMFVNILELELSYRMAEAFSQLQYTDVEYAKNAEILYNKALNILDAYAGDTAFGSGMKSYVLATKAHFLTDFSNRRQEALECLREALEMMGATYKQGKHILHYYETACTCAEIFGFVLGDYEEAIGQYNAILEDSLNHNGYNHPDTLLIYESMGRFFSNRMSDDEKGIECFSHALEICRNLLIENSKTCAQIYLQLAGCYKIAGEQEKSDDCLNKAYSLFENLGIHVLQADEVE